MQRAIVACGIVLALVGGGAAPALAAGSGPIWVEGTAALPNFPSPTGANGTFSGVATGQLDGVGRTGPYSITYVRQPVTATFAYNEPAALCPLVGTADGSFALSGSSTGTHHDFSLTGTFTWERFGTTAVVILSNVVLRLHGALAEAGGTAVLHGTFIAPTAVNHCIAGGGPITASVIMHGNVVFPAVSQ